MERSGRELETNTEVLRNEKAGKYSKSELVQNRQSDGALDNASDTWFYSFDLVLVGPVHQLYR